jgi:ABC-type spermidine/putrescine transport system permease subunit I
MILPMITFTAILLGLVQNNFVSDTLAFDTDDANYVRISATALITVASWSSTIAPILAGIAVTLVSYPLAKHLLTASEIHGTSQLPTPFQLSLIIRMISSGSFSALWGWLTYSFGWRGRRESRVSSIKSLTAILTLGIVLR